MAKTAKEYLEGELQRAAADAREITRKAEDSNRPLTEDEKADVEKLVKRASEFRTQIAELDSTEALLKSIDEVGKVGMAPPSTAPEDAKTIGEAFVRSDGYKALKAQGFTGDRWTTGAVEMGMKLVDGQSLTVESITGAGGSLPLAPQVARGVLPLPEERPAVADLFPSGEATTNTLVYLEETSVTPGVLTSPYLTSSAPAVDPVVTAEGGLKPAAFIDFTKRSVALEKLAAFLPISEEMIEDEPALASYINTRLAMFVRQAEDARIIDKLLAATPGTAGYAELGGNNIFDSIMAGITSVRIEGGMEPDGLLINPTDFAKMAVAKASTAGNYLSGGPYGAAANNPWGLRTVVTAAVAAGSPIVGAFREGGQVWRKGGITVEASNSHSDYFRRNLVAIRAEERVILAVYRPKAFQTLFTTS